MRRGLWWVGSLLVCVALVLAWQAAANARLVSPVFLPGPDRVWLALRRGFASGVLTDRLAGTTLRMIEGWAVASVLGVGLGALVGSSTTARAWLGPTLEFLRPLPASAIIPVAIALFGLSDRMVLGVIGFGALWPMLLATVHGFAAVEPRLYEVSRTLGLSRAAVIWKVALPSALPDILAGARLGLTVALVLAGVGEMLAGRNGLGQWVLLAARGFRAPDLYAGVVLFGALGCVSAGLISALERRALRWRAA
jgi:ABC-type nitrate/sulfonate/bicarbonate transport system permease component